MSGGAAGALVCGFADLAAGLGGLAWDLDGSGGLVMSQEEVEPAKVEISEEGDRVRLAMKTDSAEVEATLAPRTEALALARADGAEPPGGPLDAAICAATVRSKGWGRTLSCAGHLARWAKAPQEGAGTLRYLAIEGPEESLLVVSARAEAEASHGDEDVAAWWMDSEGEVTAFGESLLSTQYDASGNHTRAGLELWPQGEEQGDRAMATRAAGTRIGGTGSGKGTSAALLRCSAEGAPGLGAYLIWRA